MRALRMIWQATGILRLPAAIAFFGWYVFFGITDAPLGWGIYAEDLPVAFVVALVGFTGSSAAFDVWGGILSKIFGRSKEEN